MSSEFLYCGMLSARYDRGSHPGSSLRRSNLLRASEGEANGIMDTAAVHSK